jgi:uncharacterized Fe-S cluster protein YjdI
MSTLILEQIDDIPTECCVHSEEAINTNFTVFGFSQYWLEPGTTKQSLVKSGRVRRKNISLYVY